MLAEDLISLTLPVLHPADKGQQALNLMDVFRVSQLPVVRDKEYLGLISDLFIYDMNRPEDPIENHLAQLPTPHVSLNQHIFEVGAMMYKLNLNVLPVTDADHNYLGSITIFDLALHFARLVSIPDPGGIIILETAANNYSASQISQIVESNDARILTLFVSRTEEPDHLEITLKLDKMDLSSVIQTFTRYNYVIKAVYMDESLLNDMFQERLEEFLRYMKT